VVTPSHDRFILVPPHSARRDLEVVIAVLLTWGWHGLASSLQGFGKRQLAVPWYQGPFLNNTVLLATSAKDLSQGKVFVS